MSQRFHRSRTSPKQQSIIDAAKKDLYKENPPSVVDSGHDKTILGSNNLHTPKGFVQTSPHSDIPLWLRENGHGVIET